MKGAGANDFSTPAESENFNEKENTQSCCTCVDIA